tara:strand:- start:295 stop:546 length:252 start_codon:yes stop_codon:yes gene_type:complete
MRYFKLQQLSYSIEESLCNGDDNYFSIWETNDAKTEERRIFHSKPHIYITGLDPYKWQKYVVPDEETETETEITKEEAFIELV